MKTLRIITSSQQRQVDEAVKITSTKAEIMVMNSKKEWRQAPIVRVVRDTGLHGDHGDAQAPTLAYRGEGGSQGEEKGGWGTGEREESSGDQLTRSIYLLYQITLCLQLSNCALYIT